MQVESFTVEQILRDVVPVDEDSWRDVFTYIEDDHVPVDPDYWHRFREHVREHGVLTPVVICGGRLYSGHHRVWALHDRPGARVPAWVIDDLRDALDATFRQADREDDWLAEGGDDQ